MVNEHVFLLRCDGRRKLSSNIRHDTFDLKSRRTKGNVRRHLRAAYFNFAYRRRQFFAQLETIVDGKMRDRRSDAARAFEMVYDARHLSVRVVLSRRRRNPRMLLAK